MPLAAIRAKTLCGLLLCALMGAPAAYAQITVPGNLAREQVAQPGETYTGEITVRNVSSEDQRAELEVVDYMFHADGTKEYPEPGTLERSNAEWLDLEAEELEVAANESTDVEYSVTVPADGELSGTYWCVILAAPVVESTFDPERGAVGITPSTRYAVQMATHIGDTGSRRLNFFDTSVEWREGEPEVHVSVENAGERYLRAGMYLEAYSTQGEYIGRFQGSRYRLYPGTARRFRVPMPEVEPGEYRVQVVADAGGENLFGANYTLEISKPEPKPEEPDESKAE